MSIFSKKKTLDEYEKEGVEQNRVQNEALALMQMYQAGFVDGFNEKRTGKRKSFVQLKKPIQKAFEMRFAIDMQKKIGDIKESRTVKGGDLA